MFLIYFISLIASLCTENGSNAVSENRCDLSRRCMNDYLSVPVTRSTSIRCIKRTSCPIFDNNLSCIVNQTNKIYISLKDIRIQQNKNSDWIQVVLSPYNDLIKQGNQPIIVKFSFGEDRTCYEFLLQSSLFIYSKDIMLPCFKIQKLQRHDLKFYFSVHQENGNVISIQGMKYTLNDEDGQWLGGNVIRPVFDFDDNFIFFSLDTTQDLKCSFNYSIAVHKSNQSHICSIEDTPVYYWSSKLNSPYHRFNIGRNFFPPCQKYCIHTIFSKSQHCGALHPTVFSDIAFFQLPPLKTDVVYTEIPDYDCEKWNLTIDVKIIEKNVIATLFLWPEYMLCFSSYFMYLYQLKLPVCDPDLGYSLPINFNFESKSINKSAIKVFKNVTIGYYCILIVPCVNEILKDNWSRDSGAFQVYEISMTNSTELNKKDENPEFATKVVVAISFLMFFTTFSLWSFSNYIRRYKAKSNKNFPDEKERTENMPLLTQVVDEVYLFYSRDDNSISKEVSLLKSFLIEEAHLNVFTLSDVLPETLEQPDRYISELLECKCSGKGPSCASNKKYIIIISEKVLCGIDVDWIHLEELAFRKVLHKFITDDGEKAYCHLFLVVFNESIFVDYRFEKITPKNIDGVSFVIPNGLINLCMKLGSSSTHVTKKELCFALDRHDIRNVGSS